MANPIRPNPATVANAAKTPGTAESLPAERFGPRRRLEDSNGSGSGHLRILLNDYGAYGFVTQLARELARRGHDVHHVHYASLRDGKGTSAREHDDPGTLSFSAIDPPGAFDRYNVADRLRLERCYAAELARYATAWRPDIVVCTNTPLLILRQLRRHLGRMNVPLVNWLQDLHSIAMGDELVRRIGPAGRPGAACLRHLEARLLRSCAAVVPVSEDFQPLLRRWKVPDGQSTLVRNWAELAPPVARRNPFSDRYGLGGRITLLYAGTLGLKHEPRHLVLLAEAFRDRCDVAVVVVSEGPGRERLESERRDRRISNLVLVDFQPTARVPEVLGSGDIHLAMIRPAAARFSVPSKILTSFVAARSQLAAIPADNLAARQLRDSGGGLVVEPDDEAGWVGAARRLVADAPLRAAMAAAGRAYAEAQFDIGTVGDTFESLLCRTVFAGRAARPPG